MNAPISTATIPDRFTSRAQWVTWKWEIRNGKPTKPPYNVLTGNLAASDNAKTWAPFSEAVKALSYGYDGIGYVLQKEDGITFVDIDHCRDPQTGELTDDAKYWVMRFNTYTEASPSLDGVHIFPEGNVPHSHKQGDYEIYDDRRYFTVTGLHIDGTPFTTEPRQDVIDAFYAEKFAHLDNGPVSHVTDDHRQVSHGICLQDGDVLKKAMAAKNGDKFRQLYFDGDLSRYLSQSEADAALCAMLGFWCCNDPMQMGRLFRRSALYRPKWDERHGSQTYGEMTIANALKVSTETYEGGDHSDHTCNAETEDGSEDVARFFEGKRFVSKRLADEILASNHFLTFTDTEEIYHYNAAEGIYNPGGEIIVQDCAQRVLGDRITNHYISEVLGYIRRNRYVHRGEIVSEPKRIPLGNGILDITTGELDDYSPDVPFLTKLPVLNVPGRPCDFCPEWLNFIKTAFEKDDIPLCQEIAGDLLYRDYWHKTAFMFIGPGDNGKSRFFETLVAMLGTKNVATRSLQDLDRNRFAAADLYGKFANIHADISSEELRHTGTLKMLTGKDSLSAERKHQHAFTFVNYAKLLFSGNELPYTRDRTPAFFDRWVLIEMPHVFKKHPDKIEGELQADVNLPAKLLDELPGILQWALIGLRRLLRNKDFTRSKASERIRERWIARTDSLRHFVENYVHVEQGSRIKKDEFYGLYIDFCDEYGLIAVEKEKVGRRLPTLINTSTIQLYKGPRAWKDIKCTFVSDKDAEEVHPDQDESLTKYARNDGIATGTTGTTGELLSPENNSKVKTREEVYKPQLSCGISPVVPVASEYSRHNGATNSFSAPDEKVVKTLRSFVADGRKFYNRDELKIHALAVIAQTNPTLTGEEISGAFTDFLTTDEGRDCFAALMMDAEAHERGS